MGETDELHHCILEKIISRGYYSTIHLCGWIVLFCADIRAINYTDDHNVDEDAITTSFQGGMRIETSYVGITDRFVIDNYTPDLVASSDMPIKYYTDQHIVDEDSRTICNCGGAWWHGIEPGVARRHLYDDPTYVFPSVASNQKIIYTTNTIIVYI